MNNWLKSVFSRRARKSLRFDAYRLCARLRHQRGRKLTPPSARLHFGCGMRPIAGWTNIDVAGSPFDVDLASPLPWQDKVFETIVAQQVIEHLDLQSELLPLLEELARTAKPGAEIWLSCPDMEKACRGYLEDRGQALKKDRETRWKVEWIEGCPSSQFINILFHQGNEHKNLFDYELLSWALERSGFSHVERTNEKEFLAVYPEFPIRNDDFHALYVRARRAG